MSTTLSKIWLSVGPFFRSFDHNSLVSCPFLTHKVSNRSSHHVLQSGPEKVSSIQFLVWSTVRSNLGQTWSTLVKLGRIWSKLSKLWEMCLGPHFEGFWAWWTLVGLETARSNLGQPWSTLVKLGQTSPNSGKCILGRISRVFGHSGPQSGQKRLGQTPVNTRSTLVKLGQSLPNFGKCVPDHVLGLFGMISFRRIRPTWLGLPHFTCRHPRKSREKK